MSNHHDPESRVGFWDDRLGGLDLGFKRLHLGAKWMMG